MPDAIELVKTIKRAALDAVEASKPVQVCFGKVISVSPLEILVEQKLLLGERQLVLCRNVCDMGKPQVTIHNGLVVGDEVILLRQQGGQKYVAVDRIG